MGHPSTSLPEFLIILREYGLLLSGYKLNTHKSQTLTFNYSPSQAIREEFKVSWDSKSIKYLGVNFPKHLNMIVSENYEPLFSQIKSDQVESGSLSRIRTEGGSNKNERVTQIIISVPKHTSRTSGGEISGIRQIDITIHLAGEEAKNSL